MGTRTIYLVRHGTTEWIEEGIVHGSCDSPLSEFGRWEAQQAGKALSNKNITHIYCSPQGRAKESANPIAAQYPQSTFIELEGLREMDFGKMEGQKDLFKDMKDNPFLLFFLAPVWLIALGLTGENRAVLQDRINQAWEKVIHTPGEGNIAVVSHSMVLNKILASLPTTDGVTKRKRYNLGTCSISTVMLDANGDVIISDVNNTKHLQEKGKNEH